MRDNCGEVAVQHNRRVVEWLLRMFQQNVELGHSAFEHAAEVARDQRTTDRYTNTHEYLAAKVNKRIWNALLKADSHYALVLMTKSLICDIKKWLKTELLHLSYTHM